MPVEDKQAVRRFYEDVINGRNLDALEQLPTPRGSTTPSAARAPSRPSSFFGMVQQAFPDMRVEVHEVIAEGELVAARVTYTGTQPWGGPDMFSFLMQLGVMPGPGAPGPGTPA